MEVDLTQIMVILVTLVSAVMTGILFPLIRSKVSAAQWELIKEFAVAGVQAVGCWRCGFKIWCRNKKSPPRKYPGRAIFCVRIY